uniref:Uncharacterized protein n=1 Tax=Amphimedon queenslandica TaxID=400682 RepID=A0A1X7V1U6_AMPQE
MCNTFTSTRHLHNNSNTLKESMYLGLCICMQISTG